MKKLILALFLVTILSFNTCDENPVNGDDPQPGRRDYVWTADTLWTEYFFGIHDVWGSSPTSIWLVAAGTTARDCLWYYDGVKWARSNQILSSSLGAVFGVSEDEIWITDSDAGGRIWRNTGSGWVIYKNLSLSGYDRIVISSIYGNSKNNLLAVGFADQYSGGDYKGVILKYDGEDWKYLNIPDNRAGFYDIKKMRDGRYLITGTNVDNGFLEKLFTFDGINSLKEIYSDYYSPSLYEMSGEIYVTIDSKIYKYRNEQLELWKEFPGTSYYGTILGRNEKDFFGSGYDGILHFNGIDLAKLHSTEQIDLVGALIFERDVFFNGYNLTTDLNIIIRGTLKEK